MYRYSYSYEYKGRALKVGAIGNTPSEARERACESVIDIFGGYFAPLVLKYAKSTLVYQGGSRGIIGKLV